ncbi:MAG: hypothetical protein ACKPKO_48285, partial [Candidatus Fonsibacter sp.]
DYLDEKINELQQKLASQLDSAEASQVPDLAQQITRRAQNEWEHLRNGTSITAPQPLSPWHRLSQDAYEHDPTLHRDPDDQNPCTTNKAQHLLCQFVDNTKARNLHQEMQNQEAIDNID